MSDEINVGMDITVSDDAPAVIDPLPDDASFDPSEGIASWDQLTDSQKIDILHMKVDAIGNQSNVIASQVSWIGKTFQGLIDMVGNVGPMDIFKMMRGGK